MGDTLSTWQIIALLIAFGVSLTLYIALCCKMAEAVKQKGYIKQLAGLKCFIMGPVYFAYLACHPDLNARASADKALNFLCNSKSGEIETDDLDTANKVEKKHLTLEKSSDAQTEDMVND